MLEETGVWASYRRGWQVLRDNLGEVAIALLALAIGVGLFIVLLSTIIMALCRTLAALLLIQAPLPLTSPQSGPWPGANGQAPSRMPLAPIIAP